MVIFVDKIASINIKMISYLNLKGVSIFSEGTVSPNPHTDFENSDKIRFTPNLECDYHDEFEARSLIEFEHCIICMLYHILIEEIASFFCGFFGGGRWGDILSLFGKESIPFGGYPFGNKGSFSVVTSNTYGQSTEMS